METTGDRIRRMTDKELSDFLFAFEYRSIANFIDKKTRYRVKNAPEMTDFIKSEAPDDKELMSIYEL